MVRQKRAGSLAAKAEVSSPVCWLNSTFEPTWPNISRTSNKSSDRAVHFSSDSQYGVAMEINRVHKCRLSFIMKVLGITHRKHDGAIAAGPGVVRVKTERVLDETCARQHQT